MLYIYIKNTSMKNTNPFLTHLFIEMFYNHNCHRALLAEELYNGHDRKRLLESYGVFPGCEDTARYIADKIFQSNSGVGISFYAAPLIKFTDFIKVCMTDVDNPAFYAPFESVFNADEGKFKSISIYLNKQVTKSEDIVRLMMHELTHAYQDYNLRLQGKDITGEVDKVGYNFTHQNIDSESNDRRNIAIMLYQLNLYERGAFITQIKDEVNRMEGMHFSTVNDAIRYVKETNSYKRYVRLRKAVDTYVDKNWDDVIKEHFLSIANDVSDYNFKNYNEFYRYVKTVSGRLFKKVETFIPKLICDKINIGGIIVASDKDFVF